MADKKISALPAATTPLAGTEVLPIVQGGTTDQVSVANLTAGRAVSMSALGVGVVAPATGINATANASGLPSSTVATTNFWLVGADANSNTLLYDGFNTVNVIGRRANGTLASPTSLNGNTIFTIGARGYGATGYSAANRAQIAMAAAEAWTDTAQGAQLTFSTTANGGTTLSTRMTIDNAGNVGIGATPVSALSVAGTTAFTWSAGGTSSGLVTIGTQGTGGSSLFVNTVSASAGFASGLAVDGSYTNPGGVGTSIVNLKAVGVQSGGGYGSAMAFHTSSGTTLTEQMRISSAGNVTVNTGNLVIGTAGKGIDFSANTHAAGMTSELLNDYEEGTFAPTISSTTGTITTYTINSARYTKVGRLVNLIVQFFVSDNGTGAGQIFIEGFPYPAGVATCGLTYNQSTGAVGAVSVSTSATNGYINQYDGTYPIASGQTLQFNLTYIV